MWFASASRPLRLLPIWLSHWYKNLFFLKVNPAGTAKKSQQKLSNAPPGRYRIIVPSNGAFIQKSPEAPPR